MKAYVRNVLYITYQQKSLLSLRNWDAFPDRQDESCNKYCSLFL